MKSRFGRHEKFLYRRNPMVTSFISGTKFGIVLAVALVLVSKFG